MSKLDSVPDAEIDVGGKFKYILIEVTDGAEKKMIVRGYKWAGFHADIYDKVEESEINPKGLKSDCVGGGRIEHDPLNGKISVYGYSQGYGKADHQVTVDILKKNFKDYDKITWSNDGY